MQLIWIWAALMGLTVVEVALAVPRLAAGLFVVVLLGLSVGKTALIARHFMHLKLSPRVLGWLLFPLLLAFIVSLFAVLPDAMRIGGAA